MFKPRPLQGDMKTEARPGRRFLRFGLRTFLVIVTLMGVGLAWVAKERRQSQWEKDVSLTLVNKYGAEVVFSGPYDSRELRTQNKSPNRWQKHSKEILGERIASIRGEGFEIGNLVGLSKLDTLRINWTNCTDLSPLAGLTKLEVLYVNAPNVTDVSAIGRLTRLQALSLLTSARNVTQLAGLKRLRELYLHCDQVSDLTPVGELTNLEVFTAKTSATDLAPLSKLSRLTHIIMDAEVTDLSPLHGLTNLKHLVLFSAPVSDEQVDGFQKALPNCEVLRNERPR